MTKTIHLPFLLMLLLSSAVSPYGFAGSSDSVSQDLGLVPKPVKLERRSGSFALVGQCKIVFEDEQPGAKFVAEYLAQWLRDATGFQIPALNATSNEGGVIRLTSSGAGVALGNEGYRLDISPNRIFISASQSAGLFYGVQTLRQLLPSETISTDKSSTPAPILMPCLQIEDYPRFCWRGMHLDVSRHFFDVAFVKRYIDNLAMHKMNVFHWHLSDDDGWRIEIKKYPKLTEVGAWRGPKEALPPSYGSGDQRYGGFYTQEQVRDVIRYAADRHVLIVPEIDVPAHSRAATVAYPELLCAGDPYRFKSVQDVPANVLCPSQEETYAFLDGVFGELAELFPGPYLHVGGDERPKGPWEQCERCQKRMKEEKLSNGSILQDHFLQRVQEIVRAHGKKIIGWDELQQKSVLKKDYTVMAWNSAKAGIAAARKGYPVIMAPAPFTYLDLSYNKDRDEPGLRWGGVISLEKAYSFDPSPTTLKPEVADRILGVHGCLWSETLVTPERPDYMAYPRLCALAEIGWTPQELRAWPDFWPRISARHFARLDAAGILYRIPPPTAHFKGSQIEIAPPYPGAIVRYSLDGTEPGPSSPVYSAPFILSRDSKLRMQTVRPDGRASRTVTFPVTH